MHFIEYMYQIDYCFRIWLNVDEFRSIELFSPRKFFALYTCNIRNSLSLQTRSSTFRKRCKQKTYISLRYIAFGTRSYETMAQFVTFMKYCWITVLFTWIFKKTFIILYKLLDCLLRLNDLDVVDMHRLICRNQTLPNDVNVRIFIAYKNG